MNAAGGPSPRSPRRGRRPWRWSWPQPWADDDGYGRLGRHHHQRGPHHHDHRGPGGGHAGGGRRGRSVLPVPGERRLRRRSLHARPHLAGRRGSARRGHDHRGHRHPGPELASTSTCRAWTCGPSRSTASPPGSTSDDRELVVTPSRRHRRRRRLHDDRHLQREAGAGAPTAPTSSTSAGRPTAGRRTSCPSRPARPPSSR